MPCTKRFSLVRVFRVLLVSALALAFLLPAGNASAAQSGELSTGKTLKAIQTYELLDVLAANHGKIILVNFFASFCGPCRKEIPELMQMRKEIPEEELLIIGVAIDRDIRDAAAFVDKLGVHGSYPVYYGGEELAQAYRISAIPFNVIYNRQGHIEVSEAGYIPGEDMKRFLMELIRR